MKMVHYVIAVAWCYAPFVPFLLWVAFLVRSVLEAK